MTTMKKKKRRAKTKRLYFTKVHEDAIIEYNNSTDFKRKTELYETLIHPALDEMVDKGSEFLRGAGVDE